MGLSNAISGVIVMVTLVYVMMLMPGFFEKIFSVEEATSKISSIQESISKTDISLTSLASLSGSSNINFTLNNEGNEKLWNFDDFELFAIYDSSLGKLTEKLSYNGECLGGVPSPGNWCIQGFSGDIIDPKILNNGEGVFIRTQVNQNVSSGTTIIVVSTDNGVTSSISIPT